MNDMTYGELPRAVPLRRCRGTGHPLPVYGETGGPPCAASGRPAPAGAGWAAW